MAKNVGKTIVLLIVIIVLVLGGLLWFDYLGVVHVKSVFAPVYKLIGKTPQTSLTATQTNPLTSNLDEERLAKQREALDLFAEELDKRENDIKESESHYEQIALELSEREKNQEDREKTFEQTVSKYNDKNLNIEQIAVNLNGMRPQASVDILCAMDDQTVIDVLRKVEEIAARDGTSSMGSYWLSLMPAERAAEIQRKMITKPNSLD
ncbi:MAG: flagellar protein FlbB [Treponema sp.]|nr:flagellar protein FlbB [Treponema sp.]